MTPDKVHTSNNKVIITSYPFQKYPIYPREVTEPPGNKPHYKGSDNSHTKLSHGEKYIKFYEDMEEFSIKNKEDAKY